MAAATSPPNFRMVTWLTLVSSAAVISVVTQRFFPRSVVLRDDPDVGDTPARQERICKQVCKL